MIEQSDYYVSWLDHSARMIRVNASTGEAAVYQALLESPLPKGAHDRHAWVWKITTTPDLRERLGDAGVPEYYAVELPKVIGPL